MSIWISLFVAFLTGIAASLGLGGGMILMIYFTIFLNISQISAQGMNLIFFIPIAIMSLIFHSKNKLVEWKKILPAIILGVAGAILGCLLAKFLGSDILRKFFAAFIIIVGIKEVFSKNPQRNSHEIEDNLPK